MRTYSDKGFGFLIEDIDNRNILRALSNHESTISQIIGKPTTVLTQLYNAFKDNDRFEFYYIPISFDVKQIEKMNKKGSLGRCSEIGFYLNILALAITAETGVTISASEGQFDINSSPAILLREKLPWEYTEKDKTVTDKELYDILKPYANELGIPETKIGFVEVEYFG